jgi:hypothetical protein
LRRFAELELRTMHTQESRQVNTWVPFKSTRVQFSSEKLALVLIFCELRIAGLTVVDLACSRIFHDMVQGTPLRSSVLAPHHTVSAVCCSGSNMNLSRIKTDSPDET